MGSAWEDRHKYSRAQRRDDDALIEAWHSPRRSREIAMELGIKLPQLMALWGELKQEGRLPDIPRDRRSCPPGGGRAYEPYEETHQALPTPCSRFPHPQPSTRPVGPWDHPDSF